METEAHLDTKDDPPSDRDGGFDDEGPIILPPGACCAKCAYSFAVQVPGPSVIEGQPGAPVNALFCKRMPPTPIVVPDGRGSVNIQGQPSPVSAEYVCFEFDLPLPTLVG